MGFASMLEDIEDRRTADSHAHRVWGKFVRNRRSRQAYRRGNGGKPGPKRESPFSKIKRYLSGRPSVVELQEAIDLFGDPFDWPRKLIGAFKEHYERGVHVRREVGRWSAHAAAVRTLHEILSAVGAGGRCIDSDLLSHTERELQAFFRSKPQYGPLSLEALSRVKKQSCELLELAERVWQEVGSFEAEAREFQILPDVMASITRALGELDGLRSRLRADFEEAEGFAELQRDVQQWWEVFVRQRAIHRRPLRPRPSELGRLDLREEQERLVASDYDGHQRLQGLSGSGKTLILLHRALRLATEVQTGSVRVFTINRSLASLLASTAESIHGGQLPSNLRIDSFDDFLVGTLGLFDVLEGSQSLESVPSYVDGKPYSLKWCEFFGGNGKYPPARCRSIQRGRKRKKRAEHEANLLDVIQSRGQMSRFDAARYLRDEMRFIQSAVTRDRRGDYFEMQREGRGVPVPSSLRKRMLVVLTMWEQWLARNRLYDHETLAARLAYHLRDEKKVAAMRQRYPSRFILVDEAQDFSTVDLMVLRQLSCDAAAPNALFFVGDISQKAFGRHQDRMAAGFDFRGRSTVLLTNHRNTKQILLAAHRIAEQFPARGPDSELIGKPEYSPYNGPRPLTIRCRVDQQVKMVLDIISARFDRPVGVMSNNEDTLVAVYQHLQSAGRTCRLLLRNCDRSSSTAEGVERSAVESVTCGRFDTLKGFEFDTVVLSDVSEGIVPFAHVPLDEWWREAAAFYAGMTRSREELFITYCGEVSPFLRAAGDGIEYENISDAADLRVG